MIGKTTTAKIAHGMKYMIAMDAQHMGLKEELTTFLPFERVAGRFSYLILNKVFL